MKRKSKITHEMLVAEGVVVVPTEPRNKKPVAVVDDPIKPKADVVAPILEKTNVAPHITDAPRKLPEATGLQRAINANILAAGGEVLSPKVQESKVTGLQRAINAAIEAQKSKSK
jgi:hypothetical protein